MKIALLEDNPANSDYMEHLLRFKGYEVYSFHDGHSLLTALQTGDGSPPFDLALIDLMLLGDLSGQDVIQRIRLTFSQEQLPLIVISAVSLQELDQVAECFPTVPLLRKPFKARVLLDLIHKIVPRASIVA